MRELRVVGEQGNSQPDPVCHLDLSATLPGSAAPDRPEQRLAPSTSGWARHVGAHQHVRPLKTVQLCQCQTSTPWMTQPN